ncbi:hypothetical protein CFC21_076729 [Triticum aestivum]|uniref:Uncharacterized protein n=3 Tax=Triticinae TaxID=1648030 RepID=A0A9R1HSY5_WHEAT|nr:hypothetical protein CFC21_076729 [Triticum aestivum]
MHWELQEVENVCTTLVRKKASNTRSGDGRCLSLVFFLLRIPEPGGDYRENQDNGSRVASLVSLYMDKSAGVCQSDFHDCKLSFLQIICDHDLFVEMTDQQYCSETLVLLHSGMRPPWSSGSGASSEGEKILLSTATLSEPPSN